MKTLLLILLLALPAFGQTTRHATLAWDANTDAVAGYIVYWGHTNRGAATDPGLSPNAYQWSTNVLTNTSWAFSLTLGTWYFAVTAYDSNGLQSLYSDELQAVISDEPLRLQMIVGGLNSMVSLQTSTDLTNWTEVAQVDLGAPGVMAFYKVAPTPAVPTNAPSKFLSMPHPKSGKLVKAPKPVPPAIKRAILTANPTPPPPTPPTPKPAVPK